MAILTPPAPLPTEHVHKLTRPIKRFFSVQSRASFILLVCVIIAVILSNSSWSDIYLSIWESHIQFIAGPLEISKTLRELINSGAMTLFFFIIALELKREITTGELRKPRNALFSIFSAIGGMLVPALLYWFIMAGHSGQSGWGTVIATDTAFAMGCLALIGKNVPHSLRVFMLSLAIIDDIGAVLVVAFTTISEIHWFWIGVAAAGLILVSSMAYLGIRSIFAFFVIGVVIWFTVDLSGVHATITGVILGLMTPTKKWVGDKLLHTIFSHVIEHDLPNHTIEDLKYRKALKIAEVAARESLSPVERLEVILHPWISYMILPLFALANAGFNIHLSNFASPVMLGVFLGLVLGKPLGVMSFGWLAIKVRVATIPQNLDWTLLAGGSLLTGVGFTMSIFIAELSLAPHYLNEAKLGIFLASTLCALMGVVVLYFHTHLKCK